MHHLIEMEMDPSACGIRP